MIRRTILTALLAVGLQGCAGYRVGNLLPPDVHTVRVHSFNNKTGEPLLESRVTTAVISMLQQDGTLKVVEGPADLVVRGTITSYRIEPIRFQSENPTAPDEYRLFIEISMTVHDGRTGDLVNEFPTVWGTATFDVRGDLRTAKNRAQPEALRDLAKNAVERIVEGW